MNLQKQKIKRNRVKNHILLTLVMTLNLNHQALSTPEDKQQETWITIFIHGIMSIKPHLSMENFMHFMKDQVDNTIYSKTVELMRLDKYFYLNQAMQEFGLRKLDINVIKKNEAPNAIARIYDTISHLTQESKNNNYYYTFGWSGLLSPCHRYNEAHEFFQSLVELVDEFKKQGINPKIRLIGYSHGGNICLNLAAIRRDFYPLSPLSIDELILLGVPIQTETDYLVGDQIFKKVYHIYSPHDRIQQIDLFSFNRFFSRKRFINRRRFKMPDNLIQIELKISRPKKRKPICPGFCRSKYNCKKISIPSKELRNTSPGHIELWFFGWSPQHYRSNFILAPLPALITIPYLLHNIQKIEGQLHSKRTIIADIRPSQELMIIKQYQPNNVEFIMPFTSKEELQALKNIAYQTKPDHFSDEEYNNHIKHAYNQASQYYKIHKPAIKGRGLHKSKRFEIQRKK